MSPDPRSALRRWLSRAGLAAWAVGAVALWVAGGRGVWPPGVRVMAAAGWLLVLAAVAFDAVRDLFGPVFWYEVVRLGRKFSTFLLRFLYVLGVVALLALLYWSWSENESRHSRSAVVPPETLNQFATIFFGVFVVCQFVVLTLITPAFVAGTITDEKERKTIDYLFATDLGNREIVSGKLAARLVSLLVYVLVGLPVVAFLQLFGGIDPDLMLAATAATVVGVVGAAAVGVLFSALARRSVLAIAGCYMTLAAYLVGAFCLHMFAHFGLAPNGWTVVTVNGVAFDWLPVADWLTAGEPLSQFQTATGFGSTIDPDIVSILLGRYTLFWGVVTTACVGWATFRLRRVSLAQRYGGGGGGRTGRSGAAGGSARPVIGDDPLVWKEVFAGGTRHAALRWVFRCAIVTVLYGAVVLIGVTVYVNDHHYGDFWTRLRTGVSVWCRTSTGVLSGVVFFGAALRGAQSVTGEKDRDTWTSLVTTPVGTLDLVRAKWLGAITGKRFAVGLLLSVWATALAVGALEWAMVPVAAVHLLLYTSAFALAGLWCSLAARTGLIASVRAFFLALFMCGGFWLLLALACIAPLAFSGVGGGMGKLLIFPLGLTPPVVMGIIPVPDYDRYSFGPFRPELDTELGIHGLCAPSFGFIVWVLVNLGLFVRVRHLMAREANRTDLPGSVPRFSRPRPDVLRDGGADEPRRPVRLRDEDTSNPLPP